MTIKELTTNQIESIGIRGCYLAYTENSDGSSGWELSTLNCIQQIFRWLGLCYTNTQLKPVSARLVQEVELPEAIREKMFNIFDKSYPSEVNPYAIPPKKIEPKIALAVAPKIIPAAQPVIVPVIKPVITQVIEVPPPPVCNEKAEEAEIDYSFLPFFNHPIAPEVKEEAEELAFPFAGEHLEQAVEEADNDYSFLPFFNHPIAPEVKEEVEEFVFPFAGEDLEQVLKEAFENDRVLENLFKKGDFLAFFEGEFGDHAHLDVPALPVPVTEAVNQEPVLAEPVVPIAVENPLAIEVPDANVEEAQEATQVVKKVPLKRHPHLFTPYMRSPLDYPQNSLSTGSRALTWPMMKPTRRGVEE